MKNDVVRPPFGKMFSIKGELVKRSIGQKKTRYVKWSGQIGYIVPSG